jgi:hypothetical protein
MIGNVSYFLMRGLMDEIEAAQRAGIPAEDIVATLVHLAQLNQQSILVFRND